MIQSATLDLTCPQKLKKISIPAATEIKDWSASATTMAMVAWSTWPAKWELTSSAELLSGLRSCEGNTAPIHVVGRTGCGVPGVVVVVVVVVVAA